MSDYIPSLEVDFDTEYDVDGATACFISFRLGFLPEENKMVSMYVALLAGRPFIDDEGISVEDRDVYDMKFCIRIRDVDPPNLAGDGDFSREAVDRYIPRTMRPQVLDCIGKAARALVEQRSPLWLTMVTYYADLPEKALAKYEKLDSIIMDLGYTLCRRVQLEDGKWYWYFKKDR